MRRFILLMHHDTANPEDLDAWGPYLDALRRTGRFEGGSSIGQGTAHRRDGELGALTEVVGYLLVHAETLEEARGLLAGNPVYEAGGTVEIRELIED